jgi:hypothetical protein
VPQPSKTPPLYRIANIQPAFAGIRNSFRSNRKSRDWSCYQNADHGDQFLSYSQEMNDKSQRVAGIFIAPLVMLTGLWLCLDGLEHGGLSGIFAIGPFVAVAGVCGLSRIGFE